MVLRGLPQTRVKIHIVEEARAVTGLPGLAEAGGAEIPVGTNLACCLAKVAPQNYFDRRPAPEPVAVVDAVDHEPGLEHERVRDHRIVVRVGVLLDVEVLLHLAAGIERNVHCAPTEARNSRVSTILSVEIVTIWV
jgi:hypothetical protein